MKTLLPLLCWINYYYIKHCAFFLQKLIGILISLFYLLEYFFLFLLKIKNIYFIFLYFFIKRENFIKKENFYKIILVKKTKVKRKKKSMDLFLKLYYKRYMYIGLGIVYMQIFLRKIKENKNFIFFLFNYKLRNFFFNLKKKNINNFLYFFFSNNYFLTIYIDNLIKNLYSFFLIINFVLIYNLINLKERISLSFYLGLKIIKKWKI